MGLDSYIFQVSKPALQDRTYRYQELLPQMIVITPQGQEDTRFRDLLPFIQEVNVVNKYLNLEKLRKAFGYDEEPEIYGFSSTGHIWVSGKKDGVREDHQAYGPDYSFEKEERCLVCQQEEIVYWRKAYEVQSFFYEQLGDIENTGYHLIPMETILAFNSIAPASWGRLPEVEPSEDRALFYHEWY